MAEPERKEAAPVVRIKVGQADEPDGNPLLFQPDLFGGPGEIVGTQGFLFEIGKPERKPAPETVNPDQGEMFQ